MPTSGALDRVAAKLSLPFFEVRVKPTDLLASCGTSSKFAIWCQDCLEEALVAFECVAN
jgi:hypothetical protein